MKPYLLLLVMTSISIAAWSQAAPSAAPSTSPAAAEGGEGDVPVRGRKGSKQADGSQAPNKFEADPVVKSQYTVEGRPLEVDPD